MAISGISNNSYAAYSSAGKIASGNRINSAADDAAGLAISEELNRNTKGLDVGTNNQASARDMLNVRDGALASITDSLQRIRELGLQASNTATTTPSDRAKLQTEVSQLLEDINATANNTTFNTKNILNGSQGNMNVATDSNGNTVSVGDTNATLKSLGIEGFDISSGNFDLSAIDKAIESVSSMRSETGAQTNRLEYGMNYNRYAAQNSTASYSRIRDLDMPRAISDYQKRQTLNTYSMMMQSRRMEDARNQAQRMFGGI